MFGCCAYGLSVGHEIIPSGLAFWRGVVRVTAESVLEPGDSVASMVVLDSLVSVRNLAWPDFVNE